MTFEEEFIALLKKQFSAIGVFLACAGRQKELAVGVRSRAGRFPAAVLHRNN
jgi:hypothetical protein